MSLFTFIHKKLIFMTSKRFVTDIIYKSHDEVFIIFTDAKITIAYGLTKQLGLC